MNNLYVLAPGEEVIFELSIDNSSLTDPDQKGGILGFIHSLIPDFLSCRRKGQGVFVVTNTRCIIAMKSGTNSCLCCGQKSEVRRFYSFPRWALTESLRYTKVSQTCCWCCTKEGYTLYIGVDNDEWDNEINIFSREITSDVEAQALISALIEISQKSQSMRPDKALDEEEDDDNDDDDDDNDGNISPISRKGLGKGLGKVIGPVLVIALLWLVISGLVTLFHSITTDNGTQSPVASQKEESAASQMTSAWLSLTNQWYGNSWVAASAEDD